MLWWGSLVSQPPRSAVPSMHVSLLIDVFTSFVGGWLEATPSRCLGEKVPANRDHPLDSTSETRISSTSREQSEVRLARASLTRSANDKRRLAVFLIFLSNRTHGLLVRHVMYRLPIMSGRLGHGSGTLSMVFCILASACLLAGAQTGASGQYCKQQSQRQRMMYFSSVTTGMPSVA